MTKRSIMTVGDFLKEQSRGRPTVDRKSVDAPMWFKEKALDKLKSFRERWSQHPGIFEYNRDAWEDLVDLLQEYGEYAAFLSVGSALLSTEMREASGLSHLDKDRFMTSFGNVLGRTIDSIRRWFLHRDLRNEVEAILSETPRPKDWEKKVAAVCSVMAPPQATPKKK